MSRGLKRTRRIRQSVYSSTGSSKSCDEIFTSRFSASAQRSPVPRDSPRINGRNEACMHGVLPAYCSVAKPRRIASAFLRVVAREQPKPPSMLCSRAKRDAAVRQSPKMGTLTYRGGVLMKSNSLRPGPHCAPTQTTARRRDPAHLCVFNGITRRGCALAALPRTRPLAFTLR